MAREQENDVDLDDTSFADQCEWDRKGELQKLINKAREHDGAGRSDYFITSLQIQLNSRGFLTPKQIEALEKIPRRLPDDGGYYDANGEWQERDWDHDGFEPSDLYD